MKKISSPLALLLLSILSMSLITPLYAEEPRVDTPSKRATAAPPLGGGKLEESPNTAALKREADKLRKLDAALNRRESLRDDQRGLVRALIARREQAERIELHAEGLRQEAIAVMADAEVLDAVSTLITDAQDVIVTVDSIIGPDQRRTISPADGELLKNSDEDMVTLRRSLDNALSMVK